MKFSHDEKRRVIEREIKMRKRVYPRWVQDGKMTKQAADHEIAVMEDILSDYAEKDLLS